MFLFSFADRTWMMFLFLIPYCLGSIAGPNLNAYMTQQVPDNEQGKLQEYHKPTSDQGFLTGPEISGC